MPSGKIVLINSREDNTLLLKISDQEKGFFIIFFNLE